MGIRGNWKAAGRQGSGEQPTRTGTGARDAAKTKTKTKKKRQGNDRETTDKTETAEKTETKTTRAAAYRRNAHDEGRKRLAQQTNDAHRDKAADSRWPLHSLREGGNETGVAKAQQDRTAADALKW